jgi:hypothetical protein
VPDSAAAADAAASVIRANSIYTESTGGTIPGRLSDAGRAKEAVVRQRTTHSHKTSQQNNDIAFLRSAFCGGRLT